MDEEKNTKNWKERLYDKIPFSVRTMDIFIGVMIALGILTIVIGILDK